jgi:hypothetical protein
LRWSAPVRQSYSSFSGSCPPRSHRGHLRNRLDLSRGNIVVMHTCAFRPNSLCWTKAINVHGTSPSNNEFGGPFSRSLGMHELGLQPPRL